MKDGIVWKLHKEALALKLATLVGKRLLIPWALNLAIFEEYIPIETPNLFFALMIVYFMQGLIWLLAHPPQIEVGKGEDEQ